MRITSSRQLDVKWPIAEAMFRSATMQAFTASDIMVFNMGMGEMVRLTKFALLALPLLLGGCITSVVKKVVTAPIKIVSKTADVLTTSQSEADEKRGRDMRKREEKLGKLSRKRDKAREECADGEEKSCVLYEELEAEIEAERDKVD